MFVDAYYSKKNGLLQVSRQQASDFAKNIANDFNPIHDVDAKRFCVPGDLLFAVMLAKYNLNKKMNFTFSRMVVENVSLILPELDAAHIVITSDAKKEYLSFSRSGAVTANEALISRFINNYVKFSGRNFSHILVPLMAEHGVMINPDRPLVMYQSMSFELELLDLVDPKLELVSSNLEICKKRGNVTIEFCLKESGEIIGRGEKSMVLSGLRPYEQASVDRLSATYTGCKQTHTTFYREHQDAKLCTGSDLL